MIQPLLAAPETPDPVTVPPGHEPDRSGRDHGTSLLDPAPSAGPRELSPAEVTAFFGVRPATRAELPDPLPVLTTLTHCVIEILAGARDIDQIARWLTDDVYRHLQKRVVLSARARRAKGRPVARVPFTVGRVTTCEPRDGVIEAVVLVHARARTRAVAIRLEGLDSRWRASAINVL